MTTIPGLPPELPPLGAAVRAYLLTGPRIQQLVDDRVVTRTPADAGPVHLVVQVPGNNALRARSGIYRAFIQVEGRAAAGTDGGDPETAAWTACAAAHAWLSMARNVPYANAHWTADTEAGDGPLQLPPDTTRGGAAIHRTAIRFEALTHARALAQG